MSTIKPDQLFTLVDDAAPPCVSLFMPTARSGPDVRKNAIRFKNLVREAQRELRERGWLPPGEVDEFLKPAHQLLDDTSFWYRQDEGLALYLDRRGLRHFRCRERLPERVVVGPNFHIRPALGVVGIDERFLVVDADSRRVRILRGSLDALRDEGVLLTLEEVVGPEVAEQQLQWHSHSAGGPRGRRPAAFHGQGGGGNDEQREVRKYLRQAMNKLAGRLREEPLPAVVGGPEKIVAMLREAAESENLSLVGLEAQPSGLTPQELHARSLEALAPHRERLRRESAELYHSLKGTGRATSQLNDIVPAADEGRVEVLFVDAKSEAELGAFDALSREVHRGPSAEQAGKPPTDLLDLAARRTLGQGGRVHVLDDENDLDMPRPIAAILRY